MKTAFRTAATAAIRTAAAAAFTTALAISFGAGPAVAQAPDMAAAKSLAQRVCSNCHGKEGHSIAPTFPQLAGQTAPYLEAQLKAFRDESRGDPHAQAYMWGMASQLTDSTIKGLALYYSKLPPAAGTPGDPDQIAAGQKIFENGIDSENVPACKACHGDQGQGMDTIPRLAGQHREYLAAQLLAFKTNERQNETMHSNVAKMTDDQIRSISAYLASK